MSETMFRFLVSEITFLRAICRHNGCGAVVELRLDQLASLDDKADNRIKCPACGNAMERGYQADRLVTNLAKAILKFRTKDAAEYVDVEFTLPVEPAAKGSA